MTWGHFILVFVAGGLYASAAWSGLTWLGPAFMGAFAVVGLLIVVFTNYEAKQRS